jgi:hypothetical protein
MRKGLTRYVALFLIDLSTRRVEIAEETKSLLRRRSSTARTARVRVRNPTIEKGGSPELVNPMTSPGIICWRIAVFDRVFRP